MRASLCALAAALAASASEVPSFDDAQEEAWGQALR